MSNDDAAGPWKYALEVAGATAGLAALIYIVGASTILALMFVAAMLGAGLLGVVIERFAYRPLREKRAGRIAQPRKLRNGGRLRPDCGSEPCQGSEPLYFLAP